MSSLYTDYKLDNGYKPDEIIAKSRSLKGVLDPFSSQGNIDLLKRAGFVDIMTVMKYICFEGFLAQPDFDVDGWVTEQTSTCIIFEGKFVNGYFQVLGGHWY